MVESVLQWGKIMGKDINKLKELKYEVEKVVHKTLDLAKFRIFSEAYFDDEFLNVALEYYNNFNLTKNDIELNDLFTKTLNIVKQLLSSELPNDVNESFNIVMKAHAYFSLLEASIEDSAVLNDLIVELKKDYGNDFLKTIQNIDRKFLSVEINKIISSSVSENDFELTENVKKYLLFKQWQDTTHYYYLENLKDITLKCNQSYLNTENDHFSINYLALEKRVDTSFNNMCELNEFLPAYYLGFHDEIKKFVGGKGFGLVSLLALNIVIPKTYVISNANDDLSIVLNKLNKSKTYAVRSSANSEDGSKHSFAGMFDSYLNVKFNDIHEAILKVKNSATNNRVAEYIKINDLPQPLMNVLIQEFIEPDLSGVWIGQSVTNAIIEWVKGRGDDLVLGKVKPLMHKFVKGENFNDLTFNNVNICEYLYEIQSKLFEINQHFADFEWCVKDNDIYLLQYRAATVEIKVSDNLKVPTDTESDYIIGVAASPGVFKGKAKFIRKFSPTEVIAKGEVLVSWFTDPEWIGLMKESSCVVTAMGGFLCHAAIIARELGITCVTGIGQDGLCKIVNGDGVIEVNGDEGWIKFINY